MAGDEDGPARTADPAGIPESHHKGYVDYVGQHSPPTHTHRSRPGACVVVDIVVGIGRTSRAPATFRSGRIMPFINN